jgi:predicted kinase
MKIQLLVGMIASGKSTYSKNAAKKGILCVNDDSIVNMLHADQYVMYDKKLKILYKSIEINIVINALSLGKTVVIDRGLNVSLQGRKRWISLANSFDVPCEAIVFKNEGPDVHARRRTSSDPRGYAFEYWLEVAKYHNNSYSEPSELEGFEVINHISFEDIQNGKVFC